MGEQTPGEQAVIGGQQTEATEIAGNDQPFDYTNLMMSGNDIFKSPQADVKGFASSDLLLAGFTGLDKGPGADNSVILAQSRPDGLAQFFPSTSPEVSKYEEGREKVQNGESLDSVFGSHFKSAMTDADRKTLEAKAAFESRFPQLLQSSLPVIDAKEGLVSNIRNLEANQSKIPDTPENKERVRELLSMVSSMIGSPDNDQIARDPTQGKITQAEIERFASLANQLQVPGAADLIRSFRNFAETYNQHQPQMAEAVTLGKNYTEALSNQMQIFQGVTGLFEQSGHPMASRFRALTDGIGASEQQFLQEFTQRFKYQKA